MIVKSVLTLHVKLIDEVNEAAARLTGWGFEVKISTYENKVALVTNAMPRTLKKARIAEVTPVDAFHAMMAGVVK